MMNESTNSYVTQVLISSIVLFLLTTFISICCRKKNKKIKTITKSISKEKSKKSVMKEYPRAPPIKNVPIAPPRKDDDTLRGVNSLKHEASLK